MKLKNKVAIVTGGGKGIGEAISLGLAKEGAKVVVADLDKENSSNVVKEIVKYNGDAIYVETDVSNEASVKNLILETINRFNQIDILINNAGIRRVKKLENHDLSDWNDMISVNLTGPYICSQAVIPELKKLGQGQIINFGSIASFIGRPDRVGYVAAKSGILGLTRALAIDLKETNINVNTICPGLISTSFNKKYAEDPTHGENWGKETIVGRWGLPSDIVGAAIFLSSNESDFINGSEIKIDGGWLAAKTREGEL